MNSKSAYAEKLKDPRWQKKRLAILQRDDWRCQVCGTREVTLHVHHAWYSNGEPWDATDNSLYTCCADCHEPEHELHKEWSRRMLGLLAEIGIRSSTDFDGFELFRKAAPSFSTDSPATSFSRSVARFQEFKEKCGDEWFEARGNGVQ